MHDVRQPIDPAPRAVLVMRALPGLGDLLCATPALRALRAALPDTRLTLLGLPNTRELVARYPHLVDEFVVFPGFPGLPETPANATTLAEFLRTMQGRFDLVLQLHGDGTVSNRFVQLLGARRTAGFYAPPQPCPDPTAFAPYPEDQPEPQRWLTLLKFLGVPAQGQQLEFPVGPADAAELDVLLGERGVAPGVPLAVLHAGATGAQRRLDPRVLARVADGLAARGLQVVLTGTADERPLAAALRLRAIREPLDLAGRTSIGALGALVARARLVVTSDTGVSHLASALRTASVVVFLASDVQRWAPADLRRHRVIDGTTAPPTAATILAEVDAILAATPGESSPSPLAARTPDESSPLTTRTPDESSPLAARTPDESSPLAAARRVLVVPPARGPGDLGPALRRLRTKLPDATLVLLASASCPLVDELLPDDEWTHLDVARLPALIDRLAAAGLDAALVFTDEHESAFEVATLAYLAGVPLRAGLDAEFGGGVLAPWLRPPQDPLPAAERHLYLLHALGL